MFGFRPLVFVIVMFLPDASFGFAGTGAQASPLARPRPSAEHFDAHRCMTLQR
jgi:hypothetical protein